jgi:hypothetical protein
MTAQRSFLSSGRKKCVSHIRGGQKFLLKILAEGFSADDFHNGGGDIKALSVKVVLACLKGAGTSPAASA